MVSYAMATKVTSIEVIDDGVNGQGADHGLRLWTYDPVDITEGAQVDFRLRRKLKTGDKINPAIVLNSLYSHKDVVKEKQNFNFTVERPIAGDPWGAQATVHIELDPAKILGDCVWYIETHAASRTKPGVSKIKIWFTTKTLKASTDIMAMGGNIIAFKDRDCQGNFLKLTDTKFSVKATPHGDKAGLPKLSDYIYRIGAKDLGALGNDAMSSIAYMNADNCYVWLYEHDFDDPRFPTGRSRRFTGLPRWNATYANLQADGLQRLPDNSLNDKVSAMEVAVRKPPAVW